MSADRRGRLQRAVPASAAGVWALLRDFTGIHRWHPLVAQCRPGTGDAAIRPGLERRMLMHDGSEVTERLVELSDRDRRLTYRMLAPFPLPIDSCVVTVAVTSGPAPGQSVVTMTGNVRASDPATAEQFVNASERAVWPAAISGLQLHASEG